MPHLIAYIDPFTGSLLLQLLAAGFMAVMLFFKRVKAFTLGLFGLGVIVNADSDAESADIPTIRLDEVNREEREAA